MFFFFIALISAYACHNLLFHRNLAFAWLSWHHCQAANVCFRLTLASDMRSFSALEHRFCKIRTYIVQPSFTKKNATQRKVVWRKDVYNRKNPQQFSTTYITRIATLCQMKRERETCFLLRIFSRLSFGFLKRLRFRVLKDVSIVSHCAIKKRWQRHITYVWFQYIYDWLQYIRFGARTKIARPSFMIIRINNHT